MEGKVAAFAFLIVCLALAVLLLLRVISPLVGAAMFAVALAILGGASHGFRKGRAS